MKVTVIGCGEAFDSGIGNNSYLLHGPGLPTVLVDCGYQIPERLWASGLHRRLDAVYLTHTHADHSFGIVPLLGRFLIERRERPLPVIGHSGVAKLRPARARPRLPRNAPASFVSARVHHRFSGEGGVEFGSLSLACARSDHGVRNLSVRFEANGSVVRVQRGRRAERGDRGPLSARRTSSSTSSTPCAASTPATRPSRSFAPSPPARRSRGSWSPTTPVSTRRGFTGRWPRSAIRGASGRPPAPARPSGSDRR